MFFYVFFFFQAEDGIRDLTVTGVQTCALPITTSAPVLAFRTVTYCTENEETPQSCVLGFPLLVEAGHMAGQRHDAVLDLDTDGCGAYRRLPRKRSEEHTSELQSQSNLVCRLLLEKKKKM